MKAANKFHIKQLNSVKIPLRTIIVKPVHMVQHHCPSLNKLRDRHSALAADSPASPQYRRN